jgi:hypothetical protein
MAATLSVSVVKYLNRRGELLFAQSGRMQCTPAIWRLNDKKGAALSAAPFHELFP